MKIYIIGSSCSGKSTLAKKLSGILNIPHIELDHLWWQPGWKECEAEKFRELLKWEIVNNNNWIIDGNYRRIRDLVLPTADIIIWLNVPFIRLFLRSITRTLKRIITRKIVCNGNRETWRSLFSSDSMPMWVIRSHKIRREYGKKLQNKDERVIELKNRREIYEFLSKIKNDRC